MKVGIHYDYDYRISDFTQQYIDILEYNKIDYTIMDSSALDFWEKIKTIDLFIYHFGHSDITRDRAMSFMPIIENYYGIKCLPDWNTYWHYEDKIKQFYYLQALGYPVALSWVFWEKKAAIEFINSCDYPIVFKLRGGSNSDSVIKVKSLGQAKKLVNLMFNTKGLLPGKIPDFNSTRFKKFSIQKELDDLVHQTYRIATGRYHRMNWTNHRGYAYFQKFYAKNQWDTRVTTIGDRIYAFRRFVRKNDFRASGSDDWSLDREEIDPRMLTIASEISDKCGFQVMAYDFVVDKENNPVIIEISYCYGDYPEFSNGYWDKDLQWHDGVYSTQYLELVDALKLPELKKPILKATGHYAKVSAKS